MVRGFQIVQNVAAPRLVHLARRQMPRAAAQQLAIHFRPVGVEIRSENESALLPLFLSRAAGFELAQSRCRKSHAGCDTLLVQTRRRGFSPRRRGYAL